MGLNINAWNFLHKTLESCDKTIAGSKICLLGNLHLHRGTEAVRARYKTHIVQKCFEQDGAYVVSIDINGLDGARPYDLQQPLPGIGQFDIVVNGGTSEHVLHQKPCFENIHDICRIDGLMFHMVPKIDHWTRHGFYTYSEEFFTRLAELNKYSVVDLYTDDYVSVCLKSNKDIVFACLRREYDKEFNGPVELWQRTKRWRKG